jgi:16S rRNA (guanine(966)-N(2))-methyltransferase RsmD
VGELRIVAGELRRRRILAPDGARVRPTSDRVREALFDILGPTLQGAYVLDAYAGSGALGLEALSRGAASATFLEVDPLVLRVLRRNIDSLDLSPRCHVIAARAERVPLAGLPGASFDLVLVDPPYSESVRDAFVARLRYPEVIRASARVVVERDRDQDPARGEPARLRLVRTARYGRTCLDFYRRDEIVTESSPQQGSSGLRNPLS